MTDQTTTPPTCLGCVGCGGPDCIQRTTEPEPETAEITAEQWRKEAAAMGEQHLARRRQLARALREPDGMPFASLIETARLRHDDLATERAAHEQHRQQLADALGINPERLRNWPESINAARDVAKARADNQRRAEVAETERQRARRGETEAIRAREAAERQLAESETLSHKLLQRAEFAQEQLTAAVKRADLADQVKRTAAKDAADAFARAETAEAALTRVRRVAGWAANGWSDLSPQKVLGVLDGGSEQTALVPDAVEREQAAEPLLRAPDVAPHLAAALDRYLTAVAPLAEALRAALPDGGA